MKLESIEVILFLLQSKKPKRIDQIHRALISNTDYERRYKSYKKDGGRILKRILDGLLLSPYFDVSINEKGETVYSSYQTLSNLQTVNQIQFIGTKAANDDDLDLSNNTIQSFIDEGLADQALLNQMAYIHDEKYSVLQNIILAIQSKKHITLHTYSDVICDVKPEYIEVKNLQITIKYYLNSTTMTLPLSNIKRAVANNKICSDQGRKIKAKCYV